MLYAFAMDEKDSEANRLRQLLADAVKKFAGGSADKLGRLMGYTNGGFIREIVNGKKPVRSAIIERMHKIEGAAGWFDAPGADLVVRDNDGHYTIFEMKAPRATVGESALQLAKALSGVDARHRKTIAQLVAALIAEGPSDQEVAAIDALAQGVVTTNFDALAESLWRTTAFKVMENIEDRAISERVVALLLKVDDLVKESRNVKTSQFKVSQLSADS